MIRCIIRALFIFFVLGGFLAGVVQGATYSIQSISPWDIPHLELVIYYVKPTKLTRVPLQPNQLMERYDYKISVRDLNDDTRKILKAICNTKFQLIEDQAQIINHRLFCELFGPNGRVFTFGTGYYDITFVDGKLVKTETLLFDLVAPYIPSAELERFTLATSQFYEEKK